MLFRCTIALRLCEERHRVFAVQRVAAPSVLVNSSSIRCRADIWVPRSATAVARGCWFVSLSKGNRCVLTWRSKVPFGGCLGSLLPPIGLCYLPSSRPRLNKLPPPLRFGLEGSIGDTGKDVPVFRLQCRAYATSRPPQISSFHFTSCMYVIARSRILSQHGSGSATSQACFPLGAAMPDPFDGMPPSLFHLFPVGLNCSFCFLAAKAAPIPTGQALRVAMTINDGKLLIFLMHMSNIGHEPMSFRNFIRL